jgi:hypothetical protein
MRERRDNADRDIGEKDFAPSRRRKRGVHQRVQRSKPVPPGPTARFGGVLTKMKIPQKNHDRRDDGEKKSKNEIERRHRRSLREKKACWNAHQEKIELRLFHFLQAKKKSVAAS